jgi:hypothetical protein
MISPRRTHGLDIFDELEAICLTHNYLSSLTTAMILSEIIDEKEEDYYRSERNCDETALSSCDSSKFGSEVDSLVSFVSIYDLLPDSYKAPFSPHELHVLGLLKKVPLTKSGHNKSTNSFETYTWRSPINFLTYEQGGQLPPLLCERTGKMINWYLPFYGYCNDGYRSHEGPKRVSCLLCEKMESLQAVRNTLVRHARSRHYEIYSVYCPEDCSPLSLSNNKEWELLMAQAM